MDDDARRTTTGTGPGRTGRTVLATVAVGEVGLLVASTLGAVLPGPDGLVAATVTTALYMVAAIAHGAVATLAVVLFVSTGRACPVPTWTEPTLAVGGPVAAAALLAAAYVSELEGGRFVGGWGAMLALTASLVVLGRRLARHGLDETPVGGTHPGASSSAPPSSHGRDHHAQGRADAHVATHEVPSDHGRTGSGCLARAGAPDAAAER